MHHKSSIWLSILQLPGARQTLRHVSGVMASTAWQYCINGKKRKSMSVGEMKHFHAADLAYPQQVESLP
ncbi:hypothetical protein O0881_04025 [Janthinobacterium sp. SUN100]|uniref:hypothetical protein n=1 Tax=Janthinobacterium sp. SUN100 TaxID=3004101 RepID=UPI0025B03782|nr:hypothetical protein [Janthinobacterium sp. SUN100]MDN2701165.1 hypothetical protein [Janthinobacterium sp. SUN100]